MGAEQSRAGAVIPGSGNAVPHGMSTLGPNLQKRFSKGIQYNSEFANVFRVLDWYAEFALVVTALSV